MKDDPAIPTTAPALHLFPAALQPTAPAGVALALRELPPPPLLPLSLNPAPASRASANASSPPTPDDPENTHKTQKHKKKSSATKLRPRLQTPNLKKIKSQTLPQNKSNTQNHKNTETETQKQKLPAKSNLDLIRKLLSIQGLSSLAVRQCNPLRNHILWNSQQKSSANPIQPPREELKE